MNRAGMMNEETCRRDGASSGGITCKLEYGRLFSKSRMFLHEI